MRFLCLSSNLYLFLKAGGFVSGGRICAILAVSRALGDHGFKDPKFDAHQQMVTCIPVSAEGEGKVVGFFRICHSYFIHFSIGRYILRPPSGR